MQRISVNLTNDCDGNQLNYNNDLHAKNVHMKFCWNGASTPEFLLNISLKITGMTP